MPSSSHGFGSLLGAVLALGTVLCWRSQAWAAAGPRELSLQARGSCPSVEAIERQLRPLLPNTQVHADGSSSGLLASVSDNGASFTVSMVGAERVIAEPARDCMERARISAVFIALVLDPPLVAEESSASVAAPRGGTRERDTPDDPLRASVVAGASLGVPLDAVASRRWGLGPSLGVALGARAWELAMNGALLTPFTLEFSTGSVRMVRAPFDLSYRWLSSEDVVRVHLGIGVQADLLHFSGVGFERSERALRVGVGARAGFGLRRAFDPGWSAVLEVSYTYFPRPYTLEVSPTRELGKTPSSWLGLSLGVIL